MDIQLKFINKEAGNIKNNQLEFLTLIIVLVLFLGLLYLSYSFYNTKTKLNFIGKVTKFSTDNNVGQGSNNLKKGLLGSDPNNYPGLGSSDKSMLQCKMGECVISTDTGVKRCPESINTILNYNPGNEGCTDMYRCDFSKLPYSVNMDGSAGPGNICEPGVICSCSAKVYCSRNVISSFDIKNGSPYVLSDSLKGYYISSNTNENNHYGYSSIEIEDPTSEYCRISTVYSNKIKHGCKFYNDIGDKTDCKYNLDILYNGSSGSIDVLFQFNKDSATSVELNPDDLTNYKYFYNNNPYITDIGLLDDGKTGPLDIYNQSTLLVIDLEKTNLGIEQFQQSDIYYINSKGKKVILNIGDIRPTGTLCFCSDSIRGKHYPTPSLTDYHCTRVCKLRNSGRLPSFYVHSNNCIYIQVLHKEGESGYLGMINKIYLSSYGIEGCTSTVPESNFKNMLSCLQPENKICETGVFAYNIDKPLGNSTNIYDIQNSRNFCKYIKNSTNPHNTLPFIKDTGKSSGYLRAPEFFTLSCVLGEGCGNIDGGSSILNNKNNYFPFYDFSAISNKFTILLSDLEKLSFNNNKVEYNDVEISPGDLCVYTIPKTTPTGQDTYNSAYITKNLDKTLNLKYFINNFNGNKYEFNKSNPPYSEKNTNIFVKVYKQFGFNGIHYNTYSPVGTDNKIDRRVYNNNSLYDNSMNNLSGEDVIAPRTSYYDYNHSYIDKQVEGTSLIGLPMEFNITEFDVKSFNQNLSLYYPVWNQNTFQQECVMCSPSLYSYVSTINGEINLVNIQFSGKFLGYEYSFDDNEFYFTKEFSVLSATARPSEIPLNSVVDIEVGDSVYIHNSSLNTYSNFRTKDSYEPNNGVYQYISSILPDSIYDYKYDINNQYEYGKLYHDNNSLPFYVNKNSFYTVKYIDKINDIIGLSEYEDGLVLEENQIILIIKPQSKLSLKVSQFEDTQISETASLKVSNMSDYRITNIEILNPGKNYDNTNKPLVEIDNVYVMGSVIDSDIDQPVFGTFSSPNFEGGNTGGVGDTGGYTPGGGGGGGGGY